MPSVTNRITAATDSRLLWDKSNQLVIRRRNTWERRSRSVSNEETKANSVPIVSHLPNDYWLHVRGLLHITWRSSEYRQE